MRTLQLNLVSIIFLALSGCDDGEKSADETVTGRSDYHGRGSEICQDWQYSFCSFAAEKCGLSAGERTQCEDQYSSFACVSDEAASECVDAFESAVGCDEAAYFQCYWQTIADPQPAIDGCYALNTAQCDRAIGCDSSMTMEDCMTEMEAFVDCSTAVGLSDMYEDCLTAIQNWSCVDPAPTVCTGVVLTM